jgi:hypothetical protein
MVKRGLSLAILFLMTLVYSTPWASSQQEEARTPAYNPGPPAKNAKLPPILKKDQLWGSNAQYPVQTHGYELAAQIPGVLHQLPCYCYCDRMGHKSLRSCFENTHGAQCATCLKEVYYAYDQTQKGKTVKQIREGIIKGEWQKVDLQTVATK